MPKIKSLLTSTNELKAPTILARSANPSDQTWLDYGDTALADYRVLCQIQDRAVLVLVVAVGHRREIYR